MKCSICDNSLNNKTYIARELMFGYRDEFEYFECSVCGCLQIAEIPGNMQRYYPDEYYSFVSKPLNYKVNPFVKLIKKTRDHYAVFKKGFFGKLLFRFMPNYTLSCLAPVSIDKKSRILDIGCGSGGFLHTLKEMGFVNLLGIDPYLAADIVYDNGLQIKKKSLFEMNDSIKWDAIMLHHSLEHVAEQNETLSMISQLLSEDGVCLIRIPIVSSYAWEKYRENWAQLDAPRHFFLHSTKSLKLLAEKNDMYVSDIIFDSNNLQFWGSEQYMRDIPLRAKNSIGAKPSPELFSRNDLKVFQQQAKDLNAKGMGDQAAFYLRKKMS